MISELALWQELALVGLMLLSLLYVFYFRIWVAVAKGSDLLFVTALCVCVASVAAPGLFRAGAQRAIDASPLPPALLAADARVAALEALPSELITRALAKIGYEREVREMDLDDDPIAGPGPFESRIRPAVESLVGGVLRATSFIVSMFLLLTALALRSSTSTVRELRQLSARLEVLERVEALPLAPVPRRSSDRP